MTNTETAGGNAPARVLALCAECRADHDAPGVGFDACSHCGRRDFLRRSPLSPDARGPWSIVGGADGNP